MSRILPSRLSVARRKPRCASAVVVTRPSCRMRSSGPRASWAPDMAFAPSVQQVIQNGSQLFSDKQGLLSHWQDVAEHFYYERADFMSPLSIGTDYAAHSMSSEGALYRR